MSSLKIKKENMKFGLPRNAKGYILMIVSIVLGLAIYLNRAQGDEIISLGRAAGFLLIALSPLYCLGIIGVIGNLIAVIRYAFSLDGTLFPFLFFFCVLILACFLPLPPLPEETFFEQNRVELEEIIQLVKTEGLPPGITQCQADNAYELPKGYGHLTSRCVFVYNASVVEFSPIRGAFSIVYVEKPEDFDLSWNCSIRGYVWENLDDQWYICVDADD